MKYGAVALYERMRDLASKSPIHVNVRWDRSRKGGYTILCGCDSIEEAKEREPRGHKYVLHDGSTYVFYNTIRYVRWKLNGG